MSNHYSAANLTFPGDDARLGETRFETWLTLPASKAAAASARLR